MRFVALLFAVDVEPSEAEEEAAIFFREESQYETGTTSKQRNGAANEKKDEEEVEWVGELLRAPATEELVVSADFDKYATGKLAAAGNRPTSAKRNAVVTFIF